MKGLIIWNDADRNDRDHAYACLAPEKILNLDIDSECNMFWSTLTGQ